MYLLSLLAGKVIQKISRLFHNSGAALPGYVIERIYPRFLERALSKLSEGVVVISGTNGKTTTTKLVADTLEDLGERVMTNKTGSNMTRGLISTVVSKSNWRGKLPYDIAVLELDEAYAAVLADKVPIRAALILNIMRDQLDRFGEIDTTAQYLDRVTAAAHEVVVLNGDDPRVSKLTTRSHVDPDFFVVDKTISKFLKNDDEWHGGSLSKPANKHTNSDFELLSSEGNRLTVKGHAPIETKLEGIHNHLNFTAAFALLSRLKPEISADELLSRLASVGPAFGRGERIKVGSSIFDIMLVKNPSSFIQTIRSSSPEKYKDVTVVINDAYADSRDVSWLWDVSVEDLRAAKRIYTGGSRGYDIANRLKYDEISTAKVLGDEKQIVTKLSSKPGVHGIYCTYTAMLGLRKDLVRRGHAEQVV